MELGKLHLHGDICFPAQVNVGEFLRYVESEHPTSSGIAFGLHQNCKGCRAGQYAMIARKALDLAGLSDVPIVTSGNEIAELHPGFRLDARMQYRLIYGIAVLDALDDLRRSTLPYERRAGEAQNTYDRAVEALCREVPHSARGTFNVLRNAVAAFNLVPVDDQQRRPLVMLLGEIMLAAHPTANYRLEEYLVEHGMEVLAQRFLDFFHRSFLDKVEEREKYFGEEPLVMSLVDKVTHQIIDGAFRRCERIMSGYARYRPRPATLELYEAASPLIQMIHDSGEGWLIAGDILHAAAHGTHSFLVVQPFGCLPNHVFGRGVVKFIKNRYPHVQILSLDFDPDTSIANIENRLQMLIMNARELELRLNATTGRRETEAVQAQ